MSNEVENVSLGYLLTASRFFWGVALAAALEAVPSMPDGWSAARPGDSHLALPFLHATSSVVASRAGTELCRCNQLENDVTVTDVHSGKVVCRVPVPREPVTAAFTGDDRFLLVANGLPTGRADVENVAAVFSVIDVHAEKVVKELRLPNGSTSLKDIRVSPEGKYAVVTHLVAGFHRATSKVQFGWMNANALTIIDVEEMEIRFTLLLDEPNRGAANPWGAAWSADGTLLAVAHAGTHEVSVINFPMLLTNLPAVGQPRPQAHNPVLTYLSHYEGMDPGLPFLTGARERIPLPPGDLGPRAVAFVGRKVCTLNYFSDTVSMIDLDSPTRKTESIPLGPKRELTGARLGEMYFHDARLCYQGWQSCSSCHPGDGRTDGLNWDLLNDGIGNPKNTRSLLLAHQTPPSMFLGVRSNSTVAVRAGLKFILFSEQPEPVAAAIDDYIASLKPVPSPHLAKGKLSQSAVRGRQVFEKAGCAVCHPPSLFTDLKPHDVGTHRAFDAPGDTFYTPTLIEVWRTAPYLHDGSAATMRDVLTTRNPEGKHGDLAGFSDQELDDLCEYVLSL